MNLLWGFAPFFAFVVVERLAGVMPGLLAACAVSVLVTLRDAVRGGWQPKWLEVGTLLLFGGLAAYAWITPDAAWSIAQVRLCVDTGLLLIVLASLAIGHPFTLPYARERAPRDIWNTPRFLHVNKVICIAWAIAFAVMVAADLLLVYAPQLPHAIAIGVTVIALFAAATFTARYPDRARA